MAKYLDSNGLTHLIGKIKTALAGKSDTGHTHAYADITNPPSIPQGSNSNPAMDGTANAGSATTWSRSDHVHPTDTSRAAASHLHAAGAITSGTMDFDRLPVGTTASTVAKGNHSHGNITNGGDITATAPTIASGDKLIINDESASKITNGPAFANDTTKYLRNDGTWAVPPNDSFDPSSELDLTGSWTDAQYTQYSIYVSDQDGHEYGNGVTLPVMNGSQGGIVTATILDQYDSKYYAGSGLSMASDHTINHSNSVTAGTIGSTAATSGKTIAVPYATYDAQGHITGKGTHNHTLGDASTRGVDSSIADGSTSTNLPTSAAVSTFVNTMLGDVAGALVYKGTLGTDGTVTDLPADHKKGWYYIVKTAGTYAGIVCEAGDMVICHETRATASNADWDVVQTNIETLTTSEIDTIWAAA